MTIHIHLKAIWSDYLHLNMFCFLSESNKRFVLLFDNETIKNNEIADMN